MPPTFSKRTFKRQYDSGIWMGSDATTDNEFVPDDFTTPTRPGFSLPRRQIVPIISRAEEAARMQIQEYLDGAEENIDLT